MGWPVSEPVATYEGLRVYERRPAAAAARKRADRWSPGLTLRPVLVPRVPERLIGISTAPTYYVREWGAYATSGRLVATIDERSDGKCCMTAYSGRLHKAVADPTCSEQVPPLRASKLYLQAHVTHPERQGLDGVVGRLRNGKAEVCWADPKAHVGAECKVEWMPEVDLEEMP